MSFIQSKPEKSPALKRIKKYSSSTTYTPTDDIRLIKVFCTGGGAGGGDQGFETGGGAGGTSIRLIDLQSVSNRSATIVIGAGGTSGKNGGNSRFYMEGVDMYGNGGTSGKNSTAGGGSGTGGNLNLKGGRRGTSSFWGGDDAYGGAGAWINLSGNGGVVVIEEYA